MSNGEGKKTLLWVVLAIVLLVVIGYATGFFATDVEGELEAPSVDLDVEGGELPDIDSDVGDIDVGTEEVTVETPTIEVEEAVPDEE
ncbi:hypothetical protein [Sphingomicrobium astaxanthinifaciens]|uniref:hypothetical protein n=1 Tax=Sphingomicrobium astaxanthinifaciens TaxID=1227949 RepID=UPI001FCC0A61|nr:hypothetical protein [Sphingomicrobium astaxanthinifaciens]MCJ7421808.1 hypothetical protein [Sphingomicrobium astaxanthinifaciens]